MEHAREFGRLRDHADHDPLTGLRNRRGFDAAFLGERLRFERYGHALSVLMLDIDHFKRINDEHGHDAGDEVLRVVASVLRIALRDVDVVARHGGEEFVVLLPETPASAAAEVGERVRAAVAAAQVHAGGTAIPVRVSVGVSSCPELVIAPADLLASADAALYEAKRAGRDCVMLAARAARSGVPDPPRRTPRAL
jgi:diguanylate cyclase (GGDEF)-like protein